jgi:hypothetical protein
MLTFSRPDFNLGYLTEDPTRCIGAVIGQNLGLGTSWILGDSFSTSFVSSVIFQRGVGATLRT